MLLIKINTSARVHKEPSAKNDRTITTNKSPADADSRKKWRSTPVQIEVLRTRVVGGNNSFLGVNKSLAWLFWWGESDCLCFATFERLHLDTAQ